VARGADAPSVGNEQRLEEPRARERDVDAERPSVDACDEPADGARDERVGARARE
jgi:hypothetical protein